MDAKTKIEKISAKMLLAYPWWASLFLHLRRHETKSVPTMAVDGTYLYYNPDFTMKLSESEVLAVLMHETAHCALLHPYRRGGREPMLWNIACDMAVNALLEADGLALPQGCVPPGPVDKTAEELYEEVVKNTTVIKIPQDVFGPGDLSDGDGQPQDGDGQGHKPSGAKQSGRGEQYWKDALASCRGLEPGSLSRAVSKAEEPAVDWREELARFVHATSRANEHTWTRRSRRQADMAPGWKRQPESTIAACVDTSGSISDSQLREFLSELSGIAAVAGVSVFVIGADAAVHTVFTPGEDITSLGGGGGTDFVPALDYAATLNPDAVVYFTDGDGNYPNGYNLPVLWAFTNHRSAAPFGRTIYLER